MSRAPDDFDGITSAFLGGVSGGAKSRPVAQASLMPTLLIVGNVPTLAGIWIAQYADQHARIAGPVALIRLDGAADGDLFGYSIARPLDLDLDGHPDLAIGATAADSAAGPDVGAVAVFSGPFAPGVRLADRTCYGEVYGDSFGAAVDAAPDLLPDGLPGLIIGAPSSDESGGFAGKLYLLSI